MTLGTAARGTLLQIGDGGGTEVFTTVAEITDLSGPGLALEPIEMTHHGSTGGWEEFVGGILRSGEISLSINYIPTAATHNATTGLIRDMVNRTLRNFKMIFPNVGNTTWLFSALVTGFEPSAPVDDKLGADVTLKLSGQPTLV